MPHSPSPQPSSAAPFRISAFVVMALLHAGAPAGQAGVIVDHHIFILNELFIASCFDVRTGEKKWEQRLGTDKSWCSMVHAAGRLYISNEAGTTYVLEPTTQECKVLAENKLGELTRASPAFSNGEIFIRTHRALYCIESK